MVATWLFLYLVYIQLVDTFILNIKNNINERIYYFKSNTK